MINLETATLSVSQKDCPPEPQPTKFDNFLSCIGIKSKAFEARQEEYRLSLEKIFQGLDCSTLPTYKEFNEYFENPEENRLVAMINLSMSTTHRLPEGKNYFGNTIAEVATRENDIYVHVKPAKNKIKKFKEFWNDTNIAFVGDNPKKITKDGFVLKFEGA